MSPGPEGQPMKIGVNPNLCNGAGICAQLFED